MGGLSLALTTYSLNLRPSSACAAPWVAWLLIGQSSIFSAVTLTLAGHVVASRLSGRSSTSPDCLPSLSARCPQIEDSLLRRQAVRDHMTAVLGREARGTAASGNVMRVRGPALYPAPAALAADQTMSSSSSRTLGTRARFGWPPRVVVEPSASSPGGVHWSLGCSFPNPRSFRPSRSSLRTTLWREGLSGGSSNPPSTLPALRRRGACRRR